MKISNYIPVFISVFIILGLMYVRIVDTPYEFVHTKDRIEGNRTTFEFKVIDNEYSEIHIEARDIVADSGDFVKNLYVINGTAYLYINGATFSTDKEKNAELRDKIGGMMDSVSFNYGIGFNKPIEKLKVINIYDYNETTINLFFLLQLLVDED